jgi:uncharacterized protein (DUF433 family)
MPTAVKYPHIAFDENGTAIIKGTRIKVRVLIATHIAYKLNAEQLQAQYPDLRLGQIHSALAYYYDHKRQVDREIARGLRRADELRAKTENSPLRAHLQKAKRALRE